MPIVKRFAPPANLRDFNSIPGQLEAWHNAVSNWFDMAIHEDKPRVKPGRFQFYNPARFDPGGVVIEQGIAWNAFPKELLRQFGRERALLEADTLWTLDRYYTDFHNMSVDRKRYPELFKTFFRPQNEYCEWRVNRDPRTNAIQSVTFTSEPPEMWYALFGSSLPGDKNRFPGDPHLVLRRYRKLVSPMVSADDLIAPRNIRAPDTPYAIKGEYNVYNKWNTTYGIVHLTSPPNALTAEIRLGADATILRKNAAGRLLVEPGVLICCAQYGGPDRNSDPTIGAAVNALARQGADVTLKNPVGLYMDHIDLSGWEIPDKRSITECIRIVRGRPQMIEWMVVEVPPGRDLTVSDITIGGVPIRYGGQIAECITVKLVSIANIQSLPKYNYPIQCDGCCCLDPHYPTALVTSISLKKSLPAGRDEVFVNQGAAELPAHLALRGRFTVTNQPGPATRRSDLPLRRRTV
jgi:hypothetical protein